MTLPFWETYFSNFIEGTEFTPDEAEGIVFAGEVPAARPEDAHDVLGTYLLVSDEAEMRRRTASADEFIDVLRRWHKTILGGRPDKRPGELKRAANQAGSTLFVAPDLVEGTLRRGYEILESLTTPTQRGTFAMFLVAEVHPFDDGNGRLARAVMNAEYVAGDEQRAVIPTITRMDYLRALRRLSRQDRPDLLFWLWPTSNKNDPYVRQVADVKSVTLDGRLRRTACSGLKASSSGWPRWAIPTNTWGSAPMSSRCGTPFPAP